MLNERLAQLELVLVSQLSCFMNVAAVVLLLYVAFGQTHSLYVSGFGVWDGAPYLRGVAGCVVISGILIFVVSMFGSEVFHLMCGEVLPYGRAIQYALIFYFVSSGFLALAFAHLRALNDTRIPQLSVSIMMLFILLPYFYVLEPDAPDLAVFVNAQSAVLMVASIVLSIRVWRFKPPR